MSEPTSDSGHKGAGGFLMGETAGVPNWAWILVVAAGIILAVIVPKLVNKGGGTATSTPGTSTDNLNGGNGSSGLGLAIDPTTGLPYAVQGLVPSGGSSGNSGPDMSTLLAQLSGQQTTIGTLQTQQDAANAKINANQTALFADIAQKYTDLLSKVNNQTTLTPQPTPQPTSQPTPQPTPQPAPQTTSRYITVTRWPSQFGTLSGIASANGVSLSRLEQLNPQISNPNLIYAGQQIRVS